MSHADRFAAKVVRYSRLKATEDGIVTRSRISAARHDDLEAFFAASITVGSVAITGQLFSDTDQFSANSIGGGIVAATFVDQDQYQNNIISAGQIFIAGTLFSDAEIIQTAVIGRGAVGVTGVLYSDAETFASSSIASGPRNILASFHDEADAFQTAIVSAGGTNVFGTLFGADDAYQSAIIGRGAVNITGALYADGEAFQTAAVGLGAGGSQNITGTIYSDAETFHTAGVGRGAINISSALHNDVDTFYTASIVQGVVGVLYSDAETFRTATITKFGGLKGTLTANAASITNPFAAAGSVAVVAGDLVYAVFSEQTSITVTTVTDNLGHSYTALNAGTASGAATGRAYYTRITTSGTLTSISAVATASANNVVANAAVIEGPVSVSPLDTNPANITGDITSPFTCPATSTLAQAQEVVMAWGAADGSATWSATAPNVLAIQAASAAILKNAIGYQPVNSTGTVAPAFTGTNPTVSVLGTSSFKQEITFTQNINGALYSDTDAFQTANVGQQAITGVLYSDTETFQTSFVGRGAVNIGGVLYSDPETFQASQIGRGAVDIAGALYSDADAAQTATIGTGPVDIAGTLYGADDAFQVASVGRGAVGISGGLFGADDAFQAASVALGGVNISGTLYADAETFQTSVIGATVAINGTLYGDAETFFTSAVGRGAVNIVGNLYADTEAFQAAVIGRGAVDISGTVYADAESFFASTVSTSGATQQIFASLFDDLLAIKGRVFVDSEAFQAATVGRGAVNVTGTLYADVDAIQTASVSGAANIGGVLYSDAEAFQTATVSGAGGTQNISAVLFTDFEDIDIFEYDDTFYPATVVLVDKFITSVTYSDDETFRTATLALGPAPQTITGATFNADDVFQTSVTTRFGGLKGTLTGNGASIGTSNSIAGSVSVAVGDLIFAVLGQQTALTASGATDNLGNTYTAQNAGVDAGTSSGRAFYSRATVAGTLTSVAVAATSSTNDWCGLAAVFDGPFTSPPIDANPANVTDIASPFNCPTTPTLAQAIELIVAWGAAPGSTVWAATAPLLLAGNANNSTNIKVAIGYMVVNATTAVTPVFTAAANPADDTLGTASFKKA